MFTKIDLTGAQFNLKLNLDQEKQKSNLGGLLTLIVYIASLSYSIYVIIIWSQGSILPRVSSQIRALDGISINLPKQFLRLTLETGEYHFFNKTKNFFTPLLMYQVNGNLQSTQAIFSDDNTISLPDVTLSNSDSAQERFSDIQLMFILTPCNSSYQYGQTCASDLEIQYALKLIGAVLKIKIDLKQYNQNANSYDSVIKESYIVLESQYQLYNQIRLKTTNNQHGKSEIQSLDVGILFENYQYQTYVHDREITTQPVSSAFAATYFPSGLNPFFVVQISIDPLQSITTIIEAKIGEVFAQIGSIISILMALQLLSATYNQIVLEQQLKDTIVTYLYPKLKDIIVRRNMFGKISSVCQEGKILNAESLQEFIIRYQEAQEQAQSYQSILVLVQNIILIKTILNIDKRVSDDIDVRHKNNNSHKRDRKLKITSVAIDESEELQIKVEENKIQQIFDR